MYEVFLSSAVKRDFRRIGHAAARDVLRQINKKLTTDPEGYGERLHDALKGYHKLSVGDCRVVYKIIEDRVWVLVLAVGKRAEGDFENIYSWLTKERATKRLEEIWGDVTAQEDVCDGEEA